MFSKIYLTALAERGFRQREYDKISSMFTNMRCADMGWVDEIALRKEYQDYLEGKTNRTLFWYALGLEDWLRRYF